MKLIFPDFYLRITALVTFILSSVGGLAQPIPRYYHVENLRPQILAAFGDKLQAWGGEEHAQINLSHINNAGDVAGSIGPDCFAQGCDWAPTQTRHFVLRAGEVVDLTAVVAASGLNGHMQGSQGYIGIEDLNDAGEIVGLFHRGGLTGSGAFPIRVFHYFNGVIKDIGHPFDGITHGTYNSLGGLASWGTGPLIRLSSQGSVLALGFQPVALDQNSSEPAMSNPIFTRTLVYDINFPKWTALDHLFNGSHINDSGEVAGWLQVQAGHDQAVPAIWKNGEFHRPSASPRDALSQTVVGFNNSGDLALFDGRWLNRSGEIVRTFPAVGNINWINHELTSSGILREGAFLYSKTEGPLIPHAFPPTSWEQLSWPLPSDMIIIDGEFSSFNRINDAGQLLDASGKIATPSPPRIITEPISRTVRLGEPWSLAVEARGALGYQWYFKGQPLTTRTGQNISHRPTGSTLAGSAALPGDEGEYFVVLTNATGNGRSQAVHLQILAPPTISQQPLAVTSCPGDVVEFSISVTGVAAPLIKWFREDIDLGLRGPVLRIEGVLPEQAGSYTARVSNSEGHRLSEPALLTVLDPPRVTQGVTNQTVSAGTAVVFTVITQGSALLSWQWYGDGKPLPGETNAMLQFPEATRGDAGEYAVVVSNHCGSVTNGPARLTVLPPPPRLEPPQLFLGFEIVGEIGLRYRIEARDQFTPTQWQTLGEIVLTNSPQLFFDLNPAKRPGRFYRAISMEP